MNFIKIRKFDGKAMLINVSKIYSVDPRGGDSCVIKTTGKVYIETKESVKTIETMLKKCGANIICK